METPFDQDHTEQIVITPELLALLRHIVDNHAPELKKFIVQVQRTQRKYGTDDAHDDDLEQAQTSIIEFLSLMEALAYEANREYDAEHQMHHHIMPSINRIDTSACAEDVVQASVEHATDQLKLDPAKNPQELLFKELLKRWKPTKKTAAH